MNYKLTAKLIEDVSLDEDLKSKKIADGGGLHLLVMGTGKYWRFNYRINHKQKTLALGTYPQVSIQAARQAHQRARQLLRDGIDPSAIRRDEKRAQKAQLSLNSKLNGQLGRHCVTVAEADHLFELEQQGIGFYYSHTTDPYLKGFFMTASELVTFREDPVLFLATKHGVNRQVYLAWMNANHQVQCSAFKNNGHRCRAIVKHEVDAKTFEQMQDVRCVQH